MYAVLNMGYKPSEFAFLPQKDRAFVIACINEKVEAEKRHTREVKNRSKKKGRR